MRIAIVGTGVEGRCLAPLLARAGHEVVLAGGDQGELARVAATAGPGVRTDRICDAIDDSGVIVMAVPFDQCPEIARIGGLSLRAKVVVDTAGPFAVRGDAVEYVAIPPGLTAAQYQQRVLGPVRLVKAFNLICAGHPVDAVTAAGSQRLVPFAADDAGAKQIVAGLIADARFVPRDIGGLADADRIELLPGNALPFADRHRTAGRQPSPEPATAADRGWPASSRSACQAARAEVAVSYPGMRMSGPAATPGIRSQASSAVQLSVASA